MAVTRLPASRENLLVSPGPSSGQTYEEWMEQVYNEIARCLNSLGEISTSAEFKRAWLVHLICAPGKPGPKPEEDRLSNSGQIIKLSFRDLAGWKCIGLKSPTHVSAYWHIWQQLVDDEDALPASLDRPYVKPEMEWPGFPKKGDTKETEDKPPHLQAADLYMAINKNINALFRLGGLTAEDYENQDECLTALEASVWNLRTFFTKCGGDWEKFFALEDQLNIREHPEESRQAEEARNEADRTHARVAELKLRNEIAQVRIKGAGAMAVENYAAYERSKAAALEMDNQLHYMRAVEELRELRRKERLAMWPPGAPRPTNLDGHADQPDRAEGSAER
jgi:hypothetical protein